MKNTQLLATALVALVLSATAAGQVGNNVDVLNPNIVGEKKLLALPHVTPEIARSLLAERPFASMAKLDALLAKTLDSAARAELYAVMFLPIDLNRATRAEILLVPGVGKKMAHEFEEYRPYAAMAQFRREMRKYVDAEEVARLEQFVFVPMDLNTATEADFATIPGVGKRMIHEFMEYRPYENMAQFRREIGKYVSDKEVARLERYVFVAGAADEARDEKGEKDGESAEAEKGGAAEKPGAAKGKRAGL